ncbi:small kinetochore-associated protein [Perognathus longimembris pacificus]|uniref:small kinetochore-associated protein n=1 Tax=Perognathus longimembris pacificus TaxID=214514 RepID=UPI0020197485|nr:small kinetochore-associated protein [Perognathus longimembris pacificus]
MAAPREAAGAAAFRTAGPAPPEAHALPPSHRKSPFETEAAGSEGAAAVAAPGVGKESGADGGREWPAPGAQPGGLASMTSAAKTLPAAQPASAPGGGLPSDPQTRATFKSLLPVKSKEVDVSRYLHSGGSESDIAKVTKPKRDNGQMKAAETATRKTLRKGYKPLGKQRSEEDLKDKNQLLETVNQQLHQKLTETQEELKDLTQKVELLERFQDNCLAILESKGLNPGSDTLASQQGLTTDHSDSMLLLETLQDELKLFNETARKQMEELQALKVKLKMKEEERIRFLEQQTLCNDQTSDITIALEEMEQLLEM